jgi:hydroxymethylpyrimidine pyrophosphatase-like HAD family hydrolase
MGGTAVDLVVSDLDGTLWHLDHDIHHRTRAAIDELAALGIPLLVATGRRLRTTATPLAAFGLAPPAVVLNGALGLDLGTGERFHTLALGRAAATAILAGFRAAGVQPCIYVDGSDVEVYLDPEPSTHPDHVRSFGPHCRTDDLDRVVAEEVVLGFSVLGRRRELLAAVVDELGDHGVAHLDRSVQYDDGDHSLTVTGPGISKWEGVMAYCRVAGLDPGRVLAIGDGPNDLELLAGAAIAVAPADGHPAARAAAHHVVGAAGDGGWAELLDLLVEPA